MYTRCFWFHRGLDTCRRNVLSTAVFLGPFVTHCHEDLVKPFTGSGGYRTLMEMMTRWISFCRFNLGRTKFWFVNQILTGHAARFERREICRVPRTYQRGFIGHFGLEQNVRMLIELQTTSRKSFAIYFSPCTFFSSL